MPEDASGGGACIIQLLSALISRCILPCFLVPVTQPGTLYMQFSRLPMLELISQRSDRFSYITFWCLPFRSWCWCLRTTRVCARARARASPQNLVNLMTSSAWQQSGNVQETYKKWSVYPMQFKHTDSSVLNKVVRDNWSFRLTIETHFRVYI